MIDWLHPTEEMLAGRRAGWHDKEEDMDRITFQYEELREEYDKMKILLLEVLVDMIECDRHDELRFEIEEFLKGE